jgi:hypothetical protein
MGRRFGNPAHLSNDLRRQAGQQSCQGKCVPKYNLGMRKRPADGLRVEELLSAALSPVREARSFDFARAELFPIRKLVASLRSG